MTSCAQAPRSAEAQLLHRPPGLGAGDVVRRLLAVQAQDVTSAYLAFRARSAALRVADVETAWRSGEIVRTWGPRGTLHFVHADDLPWLHALTRRDTGILRRLRQEGVTGDDLLPLIEGALAGQGPLTKAELEVRLAGRARGQGVVHLVALAAFHGLAVLAPPRGGKPTYVHAADWLGAPIAPEPDRERALAELARRYRRAHRPSEPEDLAAWSGLALGEARTAWRLSGAGPGTADPLPAADVPVRLVPAFDEFLLGWRSRDPVVPAGHARQVFPGGGILRPVVLAGDVAAGVWERRGAEATVKPFGPLPAGPLAEEIDDVRRFLTHDS
ncbi:MULTISPECIES: winged helix DNA-binding domain-containing protein [unclassified Nonomuraea]|uniref:winged helix DNA-binding domain-containing protein n=1 Tax=unclassified Nonomuraea TaxID=2593643 RepID=UPI0033E93713